MATSTVPVKTSFGDRRLAAIVFTDVAGFSRLMGEDEGRTLLLIQRDLKMIGEVCRKFGGDVLKNTGDGCLATFSSVEAAVGSAIRIQQIVAEARGRLPPHELLHHRIGIHLGDVFLGQGDVLGNGVNIAARILGEAEPDGICISQTVYDLVKHRLDLKAICIGARELKNIREAVQVYRVVLDAVAGEQGDLPAAKNPRRRRLTIALASLFVLAVLGILTWGIVRSGKWRTFDFIAAISPTPVPSRAPTPQLLVITNPSTEPTTQLLTVLRVPQWKPDYSIDSAASWNAFPIFAREFLRTSIDGNSYVMTSESNVAHMLSATSPWGAEEDVTIQATGRIRGAPLSSWGLQLFSVQGAHKVARIEITYSGSLRVDLTRINGTNEANQGLNPLGFYPFLRSPSIHRNGDPNTMLVDVHDHKLSVLVNGQRYGTIWDISQLGPVTVDLIIDGTQGTVARIDQIRVWLPHPGTDDRLGSSAYPTTQ
jgi:class 3 adenylate cyclase